ncbi:MAG: FadR family transcriptional regulator [Chloroflexi bacterium]|nr:FadR family transcriptional regulator [Chloroflexota bacterium]
MPASPCGVMVAVCVQTDSTYGIKNASRPDPAQSAGPGELKLRPVRPIRLFEQVVEQLQALIVSGDLRPGDKLPSEADLSSAHGVSRASVREALRALESKGVITVRSGAGAFVARRPFSFSAPSEAVEWLLSQRDSLLELLRVRESIEGLTASLAATSICSESLSELRQIVEQQSQLSGSLPSLECLAELDVRFHLLIAEASGNTLAKEIVDAIVPAFCESNRAVLYVGSGNMQKTVQEHQRIINALAARDAHAAEAAIRAHIARVRTDIPVVSGANGENLPTQSQETDVVRDNQCKGDELSCRE